MAQRVLRQLFNNFRGTHERFTHLTRPQEYSPLCQNLVLDKQDNLVGRFGTRGIATESQGNIQLLFNSRSLRLPRCGLHTYRYQALDGSGEIEEVVGIGNQFFRLKKGTITFAYGGAGTADVSFYPYTDPTFGATLVFQTRLNGSAQYTRTDDVGAPSIWSNYWLGAMKDAVEAFASWTVTISGYAKVNGAQAGRDFNNAITVDAGHTISVATDKATMLAYYSTNSAPDQGYEFATVTATDATTLRIKPKSSNAVIDLNDDAWLGTGLLDLSCLPYFYRNSANSGGFTLNFFYWERVPWGNDNYPTYDVDLTPTNWLLSPQLSSASSSNDIRYFPGTPEFQNYKMVTFDNAVYTAAQGNVGKKSYKAGSSGVLAGGAGDVFRASGLIQYDGQSWHQAALGANLCVPTDGGVGTMPAGTYKYISRVKYIDYQGLAHYGADNVQTGTSVSSTITQVVNRLVTVTLSAHSPFDTFKPSYRINVASNGGTQAFTANTPVAITVLSAAASDRQKGLYVGDTAAFLNATTNQLVRAKVTAITWIGAASYSITVTPPVNGTIANGALITNNFVHEVFRTDANNNQFYLMAEVPVNLGGATSVYTDNNATVSDRALYDGPFTGNVRRDPPPQLSTLEVHQGLLLGAGDPDSRDSLYWCNTDDTWSWSQSSNQTTVPPPGGSGISAIASSDDNTAAVFGSKGVRFIAGDFASGSISEIKIYEGDCGCPSRHGAIKIREELWWLSNKGPRFAIGAELQPAVENFIQTLFDKDYQLVYNSNISAANQLKPLVKKAVAVNHVDNQHAIWVVPALTNNTTTKTLVYPSTSTVELYYDYEKKFFATFKYFTETGTYAGADASFYGAGGMCIADGKRYSLGVFQDADRAQIAGALMRELGEYTNSGTNQFAGWNYLGPRLQLTHILKLAFDDLDEPSVEKQYLRAKVYTENLTDQFTSWTTSITANRNFSLASSTNSTFTVSSVNTYEIEPVKLASEKARAHQLVLTSTANVTSNVGVTPTFNGRPVYTGIEYSVAIDYQKEDVSKS